MSRNGFTLVEVIVALMLLSATGAMLTRTIVTAQQAARRFDALREAQRIAEEAVESTLAGGAAPTLPHGSRWQRAVATRVEGPHLLRTTVAVQHRDDPSLALQLEALRWVP